MSRSALLALLAVAPSGQGVAQTRPTPAVAADKVLSIRSVVGGEQPEWKPDGSSIMFQSDLGGASGLWSVGAGGGFPTKLAPNLGVVPYQSNYMAQVQFFVSQGYVLLLPNIRGSSGFGRAFEDANDKDWGHGDLDDVKAGAEYLKQLPYVNPGRIGITGTSYGGCMTLSAITFAPGFFQAAVAGAGYGDWIDFYTEQGYRHVKLLDYEYGPLSPATEALYKRSSPYYEVSKIETPVMLVHGTGRFPNSHASKKFADELERYYKVFSYKTYPNENYYVTSPANQRAMFLDMLEFFDAYLRD